MSLAAAVSAQGVGQPIGQPTEQPIGPPLSRIMQPERKCPEAGTNDEGEIVVCAENPDNSPYRIPTEFRNLRSDEDRHASWDVRFRDQEALDRFSSQNVGPSGISQHSRQVDCEWRVARQELRGERPDCGQGLPF